MALAEESGRSIVDLVREAVSSLESRRFMSDLRSYYLSLRDNKEQWNESLVDAEQWAGAASAGSWDEDDTSRG